MLSCSCYEPDDMWYFSPDDFKIFNKKRRKRCCSCGKFIEIGSQCVEFDRYCHPRSDIEENIFGDEVPIASWYMCEWCGEMFFNFESLGYCHLLGDSMIDTLHEYWELTGFKPKYQTNNESRKNLKEKEIGK